MITGIQALAVTGAEDIKGVERASVILITSLFGSSSKAEKERLKGQYLKSVVIAPTMGPGVKINPMKLA